MAISKTSGKFTKCGQTLDYSVASNGTKVAVGTLLKVAGCICLATSEIAVGTTGALKVLQRGEVVTVTTDEAIGTTTAGTAIYVDSSGLVSKTSTNNTLVGYTAAAVGSADLSFDIVCA